MFHKVYIVWKVYYAFLCNFLSTFHLTECSQSVTINTIYRKKLHNAQSYMYFLFKIQFIQQHAFGLAGHEVNRHLKIARIRYFLESVCSGLLSYFRESCNQSIHWLLIWTHYPSELTAGNVSLSHSISRQKERDGGMKRGKGQHVKARISNTTWQPMDGLMKIKK